MRGALDRAGPPGQQRSLSQERNAIGRREIEPVEEPNGEIGIVMVGIDKGIGTCLHPFGRVRPAGIGETIQNRVGKVVDLVITVWPQAETRPRILGIPPLVEESQRG